VRTLILVRHAHSASNVGDIVNGVPPGRGLSPTGSEQARSLGRDLVSEPIDLGVSSRLQRARDTLELAFSGRRIPCLVEPLLDEVGFGSFEGGPLTQYRAWAWSHGPGAACPGGGETRAEIAARIAAGLDALLGRSEATILAVSHGLPVRYALDAAEGRVPAARPDQVLHATPYRLEPASVERAGQTLRTWASEPTFADTPLGG
jgi:probable phosphoglycerate mutase